MIPKALKIATLQKKKRPHGHGTFVNHEEAPILPDAEYPMSTTALFEHAPFAECRQLDLGNPSLLQYLLRMYR